MSKLTQEQYEQRLEQLVKKLNRSILKMKGLEAKANETFLSPTSRYHEPIVYGLKAVIGGPITEVYSPILPAAIFFICRMIEGTLKSTYYDNKILYLGSKARRKNLNLKKVKEYKESGLYHIIDD